MAERTHHYRCDKGDWNGASTMDVEDAAMGDERENQFNDYLADRFPRYRTAWREYRREAIADGDTFHFDPDNAVSLEA